MYTLDNVGMSMSGCMKECAYSLRLAWTIWCCASCIVHVVQPDCLPTEQATDANVDCPQIVTTLQPLKTWIFEQQLFVLISCRDCCVTQTQPLRLLLLKYGCCVRRRYPAPTMRLRLPSGSGCGWRSCGRFLICSGFSTGHTWLPATRIRR